MRILLIEDDETLGSGVKESLRKEGYTVDWLKDGQSAEHAVKSEGFDALVLDLGLPRKSGLELLNTMRNNQIKTPVLILTARDSIEDRVRGLDSGADDYMIKPFDLDELIARVRALIRRSSGRANANIIYKNIVLDPKAHHVEQDGEPLTLPRREFALLQKLLENVGQVLSREQLMQSIYGWSDDVDSNALEVHIHNLRKKLKSNIIRTIRGVGYMVDREE